MRTTRPLHAAFAILLLGLPASAQFDALPDSAATWTESFWIGPGYPYEGFFHTYDTTSPDTLYNGEVYQKLLTTYSNNFIVWGTGYGGSLRDNGLGQVYYWAPGEPDPALLYDFDVQVGDTVEDVFSLWTQDVRVSTVDQVTVNNTFRKRIGLECLDQPGVLGAYWIQGIGGTGGLFRTNPCPSVSGTGSLVCMTANDTVQYGVDVGAVGNCMLLLGQVEAEDAAEELTIYPNPAAERLMIGRMDSGRVDVEVIGPDGRTVLVTPLIGTELSIAALPAGAYVLKARAASGTVRVARFVKR